MFRWECLNFTCSNISLYIESNQSIWIAQREGRAKDLNDAANKS